MAYGARAMDGRSSKGGRARVTILRGREGVKAQGLRRCVGLKPTRRESALSGAGGM